MFQSVRRSSVTVSASSIYFKPNTAVKLDSGSFLFLIVPLVPYDLEDSAHIACELCLFGLEDNDAGRRVRRRRPGEALLEAQVGLRSRGTPDRLICCCAECLEQFGEIVSGKARLAHATRRSATLRPMPHRRF